MFARTQTNKNVYPDTMSDVKKLEIAFRLGGKGLASKPSNFPITTADYILNKYNVNGNYYDPSCGWGVRLLSALKNGLNYYGTDPNYLLCDRLKDMSELYKDANNIGNVVDIRVCGSEVYQDDLTNKIGLAFTSPPYFYLEDYKVGEQSWQEGISYEDWLGNYLEPTINNIYGYLIKDGFMAININNFKNFDLINDTIRIAERNGFYLIEVERLKNISRVNSKGKFNNNDEQILVFKKAI
nr:MAG TPA: Putative modification methylase [Caudoviricetes sp.]